MIFTRHIMSYVAPVTMLCLLLSPGLGCDGQNSPDESIVLPTEWITDQAKTPMNLHLTWQDDPTSSIVIQWRTEFKDTAMYEPKVWFAKDDPDFVDKTNTSPQLVVFSSDRVSKGAGSIYHDSLTNDTGEEFVNWHVELSGLEPDTTYYYRAGTWDGFDDDTRTFQGVNLSGCYSFTAAPAADEKAKYRFVAAGDSRGGYEGIANNIDRFHDIGADFWLFSGDMTDMGIQSQWDLWFDAMEPLLVDTVLMPVIGNHEIFERVYFEQFALPREEGLEDGMDEYAWSFDYTNTHFVGLNSNSEKIIKAQVDWLDSDLAKARSNPRIEWVVVIFHHAAYSSSHHGSTETVQQNWVPVFDKYDVDIVFNGHDHDYERTFPIRNGQVAEDGHGVVYVVAGGFFSPPYSAGSNWWTAVSHDGDVGNYVVVDVDDKTMAVKAFSTDGQQTLDEFTLSK